MRLLMPLVFCLAAITFTAASSGQEAQTPGQDGSGSILIELNKLEDVSGGCRIYLVIENKTPDDLKNIGLDVFIFDRDSVITRRVGLETRRLKPNRTYIRLWDFPDLRCASIGQFVINEVVSCETMAGEKVDCEDRFVLTSRTRAGFID